jgi:hypothetical protein
VFGHVGPARRKIETPFGDLSDSFLKGCSANFASTEFSEVPPYRTIPKTTQRFV